MDTNQIYSITNNHIEVIKDISPISLILISAITISSFFLFLGEEYNFFTYFIIIQSLIILLVYQINSSNINRIFNVIIYITLIILYFFIIFYNIVLYNNSDMFTNFIKFILLIYILLFSQPTNSSNIFSVQTVSIIFLIIYIILIIYEYFITNSLNREL